MPGDYDEAQPLDGPFDWERAWRQNPNVPADDYEISQVSDVRVKAAMYVHRLRLVADTIESNNGLMTEEDPYDAALSMLQEYDTIAGGYYDPDPGEVGGELLLRA